MIKKVLFCLFLTPTLFLTAQYSIQIGSYHNIAQDMPVNNEYDYNWSSTLYYQDEINMHGDITSLYYDGMLWGNFGTGYYHTLSNQRIFMKLTGETEFSTSAFPDTNSMTLVYAGPVNWYDEGLTEILLDAPFSYDNTGNLQILYINKNGTAETISDLRIFCGMDNNSSVNRTIYNHASGAFPGGDGTQTNEIPITCFRFSSGTDVGISAINHNVNDVLAGPLDLTVNFRNYMSDTINSLDIDWTLNGVPQTPISWTGELFPGQQSGDIVLESMDLAPGNYTVVASTSAPNGGTDDLTSNDAMSLTLHSGEYIEIGANDGSFRHAPVRTDMNYGWTSSLYSADSVGINGFITGISYNVATNPCTLPYQKIFLTTNSRTEFFDGSLPDEIAMKAVFDGTVEFASTGWNTIPFDSVFTYSDAQNLQVYYQDHSNAPQYYAAYFYKHNRALSTIYHPDDTQFPAQSGLTYDAAPNIRFHFALPNDAGISAVDAPYVTTLTGSQEIRVTLLNNGSETLNAVDVNYRVDGGGIQTVNWTGSLAYGETAAGLALGGYDFAWGAHTLKVWTSAPNGYNDYVNENDTLEFEFFAGIPLSGTYVVGEAPSDFLTLREVFDSLNSPAGINGAVVFELKPGTYNSQFTLGEVAGSSADHTITFRSQSGDSTDVVLISDSTDYIVRLDGTDFVQFSKLGFMSESAANYIEIAGGVNHSAFTGNRFIGTAGTQNLVVSPEGSGSVDTDNRFEMNYFEGAQNGLVLYSEPGIYETGNLILNNTFENQSGTSVILKYQSGLLFDGNTVQNESAYALHTDYLDGIHVLNNRIEAGGVYQCPVKFNANADTSIIANNFFICPETNNGAVKLSGQNYLFAFNTVVSSGSSSFHGSLVVQGDHKMIWNNILVNQGNGYAIYVYPSGQATLQMDYNCLYTSQEPLGYWNNSDQATFPDWQTASGQDASSLSLLPAFVSGTDLHTGSFQLDGSGTPLVQVTTDIDGESRDPVSPDIGADEFTSPCSGPLAGDYTIGASGDYAGFRDAVFALNSCGVSGTVHFYVEEGTYNEQVKIDNVINGYTESDTIIFESLSQDSTAVLLTFAANSASNYTLMLDGADRIVFRKLTLQAENPDYGRVIEITNGAHDNRFDGNRILGVPVEANAVEHALVYSGEESAPDTGNVFINNYLQDGAYGFYFTCDASFGRSETFTVISDNTISGACTAGIFLGAQEGAVVNKNRISGNRTGDDLWGMQFDYMKRGSATVTGNRITVQGNGSVYGIDANGINAGLLANNFVTVIADDGNAFGIRSLGFGTRCYYNSVAIYGSGTSAALELRHDGTTTPDIKNNNLVNLAGGFAVQEALGAPSVDMDHNNLYSNGYFIANWNSQNLTSLADWQSVSGQGMHSVSVNPVFVSETDLHTRHVLLNGTAVSLAEVTTDIDDDARDASTPDIGADEFNNPGFELGDQIRGCIDELVVVNAGTGFDSYSWSDGSDSSAVVIDSTGIGYGEQEIWVTAMLDGTEYSDSITVVFSSPVAAPMDYCINSYEDSLVISAGEGSTYLWESGATTQSTVIYQAGYYDITVTDAYGCADNGTVRVELNSCEAHIGGAEEGAVLQTNETLDLVASAYCDADYALFDYLWSTGDTTYSITLDGSAMEAGNHEISLTIINNSLQNCESADTLSLWVEENVSLSMAGQDPEILVYPNPGTGVFHIKGEDIRQIEVFNLQGNSVYKAENPGDVPVDLSKQPEGTYLVKIISADRCVYAQIILE